MDTSFLEKEALNIIQYKLHDYGFGCGNPTFDENGVDFLAYDTTHNLYNFLKCQSKGRTTITNSSSVKIDVKYPTEDYVCFVYVKTKKHNNEANVYMYCYNDIINWPKKDNHYCLYIGKTFTLNRENDAYRFTEVRAELLAKLFEDNKKEIGTDAYQVDMLTYCYKMWQDYGSYADARLIKQIDVETENNLRRFANQEIIFFMCMCVINEDKGDLYGIDWGFQYIREMGDYKDIDESLITNCSEKCYSNWGVTYHNTYVEEITYNRIPQSYGMHLHIGNSEEWIDAYLLRDGRCSVSYHVFR